MFVLKSFSFITDDRSIAFSIFVWRAAPCVISDDDGPLDELETSAP